MKLRLRLSIVLAFSFPVLAFGAGSEALPSLDFCAQGFLRFLDTETQVVSLAALRDRKLSQQELRDFFQKLRDRASELTNTAQRLSVRNLGDAEKFYREIGRQVPREGYVRALSVKEIQTIFREGGMGSFYDFNFVNDGARVGHGGNFVFLLCRKCPPDQFMPGNLGSGVVNRTGIRLEQLEIVIPSNPRAEAAAR